MTQWGVATDQPFAIPVPHDKARISTKRPDCDGLANRVSWERWRPVVLRGDANINLQFADHLNESLNRELQKEPDSCPNTNTRPTSVPIVVHLARTTMRPRIPGVSAM